MAPVAVSYTPSSWEPPVTAQGFSAIIYLLVLTEAASLLQARYSEA
ncbi:MAG: hypothetical protein IJV28_07390 [Paludibacteraceae bacterium]|nr:hypothetical protein [Paludibacteraceae bacterium]